MGTLSPATEDYLKAVYVLTTGWETEATVPTPDGSARSPVTTGALARELGVSSPSVSAMVKRLAGQELVERPGGRRLRLTDRGERAAVRVVRRHRLLETFLARKLEMPWDEVNAEADLLEHALSDRLEKRIDAALGHPTRDPHGDPIQPQHGPHDETWGQPLDGAAAGCRLPVPRGASLRPRQRRASLPRRAGDRPRRGPRRGRSSTVRRPPLGPPRR